MLLFALSVGSAAQGAPEQIQDALAAFTQELGTNLFEVHRVPEL